MNPCREAEPHTLPPCNTPDSIKGWFADRGQSPFRAAQVLDQDQCARSLGEIAIGTNYGIKYFSKNTLFDEKIGGTFHAACGAEYPESGSDNESGLHWNMICDLRPDPANNIPGGTIEADGEVFHKNGKFLSPAWNS